MTIVDLSYSAVSLPRRRPHWLVSFGRLLASSKRHRAERRALLTLSRLDHRLLRDMGVDPQDVIAAFEGRPAPSIAGYPMRLVEL